MSLTLHENIVPSGEHTRSYNDLDNMEMCAVASSLEDSNPPLVIHHREEIMADGQPKLNVISDTDRVLFVFLFQDGGNGWNPTMKYGDEKTKLTLQKYSVYTTRNAQ